tara:strand:- start:2115 stop:3053 length:939 start_codon:yes stop_codon:yes gene_type:complete
MRLNSVIENVLIDDIKSLEFDLILVSSGYEERASFLISNYRFNSKNKLALSFKNYGDIKERLKNDGIFLKNGYKLIQSHGDDDSVILSVLENLNFRGKNGLNILIDYSSMTRVWYSAILNYFRWLEVDNNIVIDIYFSYSLAKFSPPPTDHIPNRHIGPIKGFYSIALPLKPTALIIGLGYEKIRAFGLTEFLDSETLVFLTDSSQGDFTNAVRKENYELLKIVDPENIFNYSFDNIVQLHHVLFSLCEKLTEKFRIIIAPCGPKPFTLISLLNSILLKDIDIWRISPGSRGLPENRIPTGKTVVVKTKFLV